VKPPENYNRSSTVSDLRTYLSGPAQRELETLRSALDARLIALERALANPEPGQSIESLIIDLARVASEEAHASAARKWLEAQLAVASRPASARGGEGGQGIQGALIEEAAGLRRELEDLGAKLQAERAASARLDGELLTTRHTNVDLSEAVETLRNDLDSARKALAESQREAGLARRQLEAALSAAQSGAADRDATQSTVVSLSADLERERSATQAALADVEALRGELAAARDAVRAANDAAKDNVATLTARLEAAESHVGQVADQLRAAQADGESARAANRALEERLAELERAFAAERDDLRGKKESADQRAASADANALAAEALIAEASARADAAEAALTQERDRATAERLEATRSSADRLAEIERSQAAYTDRFAEAEKLRAANQDLSAEVEKLRAAHADVSSEAEKLRTAHADASSQAEKLRAANLDLSTEAESLRAAMVERAAQTDVEMRLAAASTRIRELELQLFGRDRSVEDSPDLDLAAMLEDPAPTAEKPIRRFSRYGFRSKIDVQVDTQAAQLVDLSVGGAQVLSASALDLHHEASIALVSDEIPVSCRGKIVWSRADPHSRGKTLRYRAGILFTDADPSAVEAFIIRYSST
jgi:chromosome segregation ATPase